VKPAPDRTWTRRRAAARAYQPRRIRLLLIAEAPPADDDRYFYFEHVGTADFLFEKVCGVLFEQKPERDKVPFLKELRRRGVFLIDLKPDAPRSGGRSRLTSDRCSSTSRRSRLKRSS